jgi:hypothetical protein
VKYTNNFLGHMMSFYLLVTLLITNGLKFS